MTSIISSSSVIRNPSSVMNGWIILDKPIGMSSAAAVAKVKWLLSILSPRKRSGVSLGEGVATLAELSESPSPRPLPVGEGEVRKKIKIGHAGTLDPLASGVLPLALGEATKTVSYMMDAAKSYAFTVTWGQERATDDAEGEVLFESEKRPTSEEISQILPQFIGNVSQTPPNYSAIKLGGKRAYDLARSGQVVEIKAREVIVKSLEIQKPTTGNRQPTTSFICHCGKGTYIRSLARDMGRILGCYGYISSLRRLNVGKFNESCAISLENLADMVHKGNVDFLQPVESALDDILAWDIDSIQALRLRRGQTVDIPDISSGDSASILVLARDNGKAMAICEWQAGVMKPVRVFNL